MLPEIYKQLNVDKMFVMGDGQEAFSSLAESIIPFLTVLPEITGRSFRFTKDMAAETAAARQETTIKAKKPALPAAKKSASKKA